MSITYNLPISDWYFDETSEWTLDYPPLFAAFEFLLALFAQFSTPASDLVLTEQKIRTESIIIFQKSSVIVADFVYYYSVFRLCSSLEPFALDLSEPKRRLKNDKTASSPQLPPARQGLFDAFYRPDLTSCIALLLLFQPGLLIVDHIHFQYNGLLSGVLLLSMASIIEKNYVLGTFWFAILLNLKHIYLYCAPAFGMYVLTVYCMAKETNRIRFVSFITKCLKLGVVVLLVFAIVFGPFADIGTVKQILFRLFPFKRGLTHAYWAPNIWAIYNTADKILATVYKDSIYTTFDIESISRTRLTTSTSGLVQEYKHLYLPSIDPLITFSLVGAFMVPLVMKFLLRIGRPSLGLFMKAVTLTSLTSFMFGWHVHEKAIIVTLLPLIPISFMDETLKTIFLRLTLAGTYSLFPLLFQPAEYLTKLVLLVAYYLYASALCNVKSSKIDTTSGTKPITFFKKVLSQLYELADNSFILALVSIEIYNTFLHNRKLNPVPALNKYEFFPLLLTSSFSALGITWSYLELYYDFVLGADAPAFAASVA